MLKLSLQTTPIKGSGGLRGRIWEFSPQSRKRMLQSTACLDRTKLGFLCFVTLTYPDRHGPPSLKQTERDRQTFLKRIKREYPEAAAIWRRERELRKSGAFVGVEFPHYHLLFVGLPFLHWSRLNEIWREVLGYGGYIRTEIKTVESWKQALFYVSKYMAKTKGVSSPRPAANRRQANAAGRGDGSLVYVAYLTAEGSGVDGVKHPESIGRSWGIHNRGALPWADVEATQMRAGPWLEVARHEARKLWPGLGRSESTGFTLFLDNAYEVYQRFCNLRKPGP